MRVLCVCLVASSVGAAAKIYFGAKTGILAFVADGVHSLFDSTATIVGIISVISASKPPDAEHPYGHEKFETIASMMLAFLLMLAGYEMATFAVQRILNQDVFPTYSPVGLIIVFATMSINLAVSYYEGRKAVELSSPFLLADSFHNRSDFLIGFGVLISLISVRYHLGIVDGIVAVGISLYLGYLAYVLIRKTINPLVDHRVLDPKAVEAVASSVKGVLDCHAVRSRGQQGHHFLDLNIHLSGKMTLDEAHSITHQVETRLKDQFPGLADVVIHTEPHGHPPCCA